MGARSVTDSTTKQQPSWRLKPPNDVLTQGMVVSGFSDLPAAEALFLLCDWPESGAEDASGLRTGAWLKTLKEVAPITDADGSDPRSAAIAFTWTGLHMLGLGPEALKTFSRPFREGMFQEDRLRRLGDKIDDEWQGTVIEGGPGWSGNILACDEGHARSDDFQFNYLDAPKEREERKAITPKTVHALLLLYGPDRDTVLAWAHLVEKALAPHHVKVNHRLSLDLRFDNNQIAREHFGFADGLSQPIPFGDDSVVLSNGEVATRDPWHGVPLGEILLGHTNAHGEKAPGPVVRDDPEGRARALGLEKEGAPDGFLNFGLNGSYMVVRELRQDVAAFWKSLEAGAKRFHTEDGRAPVVTADWLAERVVGRSVDGHLLCPNGYLPADEYSQPQNAFGFLITDPQGLGCPMGSHVRRANPRDGLAKDLGSAETLLSAANNHRILRRGRKYGTTLGDRYRRDDEERGLLFICLNSDIARQFEFVQQNWILNQNFATLFDETDPLVGPKGQFTIPEQPLRRIVDVETFVQSAGGEYFFLPSMPALNYLAAL
jgi:Dyp-type peroxidase family